MAAKFPANGCFHCGNPLHKQWQCKLHLSREARKATHNQFLTEHPEKKEALGRARMAKLQAKEEWRRNSANISVVFEYRS